MAPAIETSVDAEFLTALAVEVAEISELALGHSVVWDRVAGTARLAVDQAADLGVLGYMARASGLTSTPATTIRSSHRRCLGPRLRARPARTV